MDLELDCIIKTGRYTFHLGEENGGEVLMFLEYDFHTTSEQELGGQLEGVHRTVHRVKNGAQVRDFLMKLGFLNRDEAGGDRVKGFLHLSQVSHFFTHMLTCKLTPPPSPQTASTLFELYLKLNELGHPDYITVNQIPPIPCSNTKESMESIVEQTQLSITEWSKEVSHLRTQYTWLLYFSVPKMLLLYWLIRSSCQGEKMLDEIVHEVSFLMINQPEEREKLSKAVLVSRNQ